MNVRQWTGWQATVWLAPAILVAVVVRQMYLVQEHDLTPWLGGGYGMFATIDRVDHRVVRAYAVTPEGEVPLQLPRLDDRHRLEMKARIVPQTLTRPGFDATRRLQRLEMKARVMPTSERVGALADELLGLTWSEPDSLPVDVLQPEDTAIDTGPLDVRAVRVEVWRLRFESRQCQVTADCLARVTASQCTVTPTGLVPVEQ